jgi:hypothetical protein
MPVSSSVLSCACNHGWQKQALHLNAEIQRSVTKYAKRCSERKHFFQHFFSTLLSC